MQLYAGDTASFFVMSVHSLVADFPSLLVLLDDLRVLYGLHSTAERAARNRSNVATLLMDDSDASDTEGGCCLCCESLALIEGLLCLCGVSHHSPYLCFVQAF